MYRDYILLRENGGLDVLDEMMKSLNESYKFLECEQAEAIKADVVYKRVSKKMENHIKPLTDKRLHERNPEGSPVACPSDQNINEKVKEKLQTEVSVIGI